MINFIHFKNQKPIFMRKQLLLMVVIVSGLTACQKSKVTDKVESTVQTTRKPKFKFQDSIPPGILVLMKKNLMDDGYTSKAENLAAEYDFTTGERKKLIAFDGELAGRDYPTTPVSGVGTVLANVEFIQNGGANHTTSLFSCSNSASIQFNAMNSGAAIHAYDNTSAPAGTYLSVPGSTNAVGFRLPVLQAKITDVNGFDFLTNFFPLFYAADPVLSSPLNYVQSGTILQAPPGGPFNTCQSLDYLDDLQITIGGSGIFTLNDGSSTQVKALVYYRTKAFFGGWSNWLSDDQPTSSFLHIQIRIYFVLV
jgi:hypothetical protein